MNVPPTKVSGVSFAQSVASTVIVTLAWICPLAGGVLLYSDATGQRPIHDQAAIGITLLAVPVGLIVSILVFWAERPE